MSHSAEAERQVVDEARDTNERAATNAMSSEGDIKSDVNSTYASNVNGLPKTDFDAMRSLANNLVDNRFTDASVLFLRGDGQTAGKTVLNCCSLLEQTVSRVNFNAFDYPEPASEMSIFMGDMVIMLSMVYLVRSKLRAHDLPIQEMSIAYKQLYGAHEEMRGLLSGLVSLAQQKDKEYGASWCKRGGIGAWFTTVRKFDRLITQVQQKGNNIWDISDDAASTESLEETIKDGINYLLLILEKRQAIHNSRKV